MFGYKPGRKAILKSSFQLQGNYSYTGIMVSEVTRCLCYCPEAGVKVIKGGKMWACSWYLSSSSIVYVGFKVLDLCCEWEHTLSSHHMPLGFHSTCICQPQIYLCLVWNACFYCIEIQA